MYIGAEPNIGNYSMLDAITTSATATYNLLKGGASYTPENPLGVICSLNGVIQKAGSSFNIVNNTIVFSQALTSNDSIDFILVMGERIDLNVPADASVNNAKTNFVSTSSNAGLQIKGDGTTDGTLQLNCSQNSHGIKIKSPPHSASASYTLTMPNNDGSSGEALTTDGSGVLSWASAGGSNTPMVSVDKTGSQQSISASSHTKVTLNTERVDSDNAFASNTFTVPSGKAGKYFLKAHGRLDALNGASEYGQIQIANSDRSTQYATAVQSGKTGYGFEHISCSVIRTLSVGDTISLYCYATETVTVAEDNTNLTIIRLVE